jgi:hypothetical protein
LKVDAGFGVARVDFLFLFCLLQLGVQNAQLQHQQQQLLPSPVSLSKAIFCFGSSWRGLLYPTLTEAFSSPNSPSVAVAVEIGCGLQTISTWNFRFWR